MKTLFKKTLSVLLALFCFGGMFAAAAETPAAEGEFRSFQTSEEYDDTGKNILPADNGVFKHICTVVHQCVRFIGDGGMVVLHQNRPVRGNSGEQHRGAV